MGHPLDDYCRDCEEWHDGDCPKMLERIKHASRERRKKELLDEFAEKLLLAEEQKEKDHNVNVFDFLE